MLALYLIPKRNLLISSKKSFLCNSLILFSLRAFYSTLLYVSTAHVLSTPSSASVFDRRVNVGGFSAIQVALRSRYLFPSSSSLELVSPIFPQVFVKNNKKDRLISDVREIKEIRDINCSN